MEDIKKLINFYKNKKMVSIIPELKIMTILKLKQNNANDEIETPQNMECEILTESVLKSMRKVTLLDLKNMETFCSFVNQQDKNTKDGWYLILDYIKYKIEHNQSKRSASTASVFDIFPIEVDISHEMRWEEVKKKIMQSKTDISLTIDDSIKDNKESNKNNQIHTHGNVLYNTPEYIKERTSVINKKNEGVLRKSEPKSVVVYPEKEILTEIKNPYNIKLPSTPALNPTNNNSLTNLRNKFQLIDYLNQS